jgi:hypothetical protein
VKRRSHKKATSDTIFIPWFGQVEHLPTSTLWRPNGRGLHSTLIIDIPFVRNLHMLESLTLTRLISMKTTRVREGKKHTQESQQSHAHKSRHGHTKTQRREFTTREVLKSQTRRSGCVLTEPRHLRMFNGGLCPAPCA